MITQLRRHVPLWARLVAFALAGSFIAGRGINTQPPGQITAAILRTASTTCPAALPSSRSIRIADGARTLDRMALASVLKAVGGRDLCARNAVVR